MKEIVGEHENLRHRSKASGNRPPRVPFWTKRLDKRGGLVHDSHIRVSKSVDGLLAISDEKDRRIERSSVRDASAFSPRANQQRDERPLSAARVLKFVEQHMMVPPFEAIPASRKFLHLCQQEKRAREDLRKVEETMRIKRVTVLAQRDLIGTTYRA